MNTVTRVEVTRPDGGVFVTDSNLQVAGSLYRPELRYRLREVVGRDNQYGFQISNYTGGK